MITFICDRIWQIDGTLKAIPQTDESYISFSQFTNVGEHEDKKTERMKKLNIEIRFLDSFRFMVSSLAFLASNLAVNDMIILRKYRKNESFNLLRRKGI